MKSCPAPAALIAGDGALPGEVARRMADEGIDVTVYTFAPGGDKFSFLPGDRVISLLNLPGAGGTLSLKAFLADLSARGIRRAGMAGLIPKMVMYGGTDNSLKELLKNGDNDDHALLGRIAAALEMVGVEVFHYGAWLKESMASEGQIAGRKFTPAEAADVEYGKKILAATLPLSFGQAVVIAGGAVVAIEAMEGTDRMIQRAGELLRGTPGVVVKMMRPDQDSRYDIPTVGPRTLEEMDRAGLTALALETGRVIILEREKFSSLAGELSIAAEGILP